MTNAQKTLVILAGLLLLMGAGCGSKSNTTLPQNTDQPSNNSTVTPGSIPTPLPIPGGDTNAAKPKTVGVNYSNGEFTPKSITINVGDTVIFENMGDDATTTFKGDVATFVPGKTGLSVWPAAGPHPIHNSVPGFDAKRPLIVGETYSFTFTKAQTVTYHNHLNPSQTGTIIVK